ncbi:B-cell receptor CD22 isoform X3 [Paramisgurnus dabryanus]|uniref:B-cell receptor CD22 isoform X3 n=1 Tax=Paramisgurnus dabryanus TaxID=90735 RepID=UPI0031F43569
MFYISILMQLSVSAAVSSLSVSYSPKSICTFENSSVDFSCTFDFPYGHTLVVSKWFKPRKDQKQDGSQEGMFVYHTDAAEIHELYMNRATYANQDKNCSLKLHNVSRKDIGKYFFRFETNYWWLKYTGPGGIDLIVAVLPFRVTVNTQKTKREIHEGDSVTLTCNTENCTPTQEAFIWFKNGLLLPKATKQMLRFSSVSHEDFGNYSCGLKNSDTTSTIKTLLDVRYRPQNVQIIVFPSKEIEEGDSLTLTCKSNANPAVTNYTWFKISDTNTSYIGYGSKYSLTIVSQKDAGRYLCVAVNDVGSQNSTVIELKVKEHSRLDFLFIATTVLLLGIAVTLIIFCIMKRRKQIASKKLPAEKTPTVAPTEEIYENLRNTHKSEENSTNLTYADLMLPPASSDRPQYNSQEDMTVIYSILSDREKTKTFEQI